MATKKLYATNNVRVGKRNDKGEATSVLFSRGEEIKGVTAEQAAKLLEVGSASLTNPNAEIVVEDQSAELQEKDVRIAELEAQVADLQAALQKLNQS